MAIVTTGRNKTPTLALALGGGGARGLVHIVVLEALDELGIVPSLIAGTSMGAVVGAAYAAGIPARELRTFVLTSLRDRARVYERLLAARVGRLSHLMRGPSNPALIDGEKFLDLFWPEAVPDRFEQLKLPFMAVATDYFSHRELLIREGPLVTAVAGSMAMPGYVRPVRHGTRVLVDGGAINPLPFEPLLGQADVVLAVDVSRGPTSESRTIPEAFEAMLGASLILQNALVAEKLKARRPDIVLRPDVGAFRALAFFKAKAIFAAAEAGKDDMKRALAAALSDVRGKTRRGAPRPRLR